MGTMIGFISAVLVYMLVENNLAIAANEYNNLDAIGGNLQMSCNTNRECEGIGFKGSKCIDNLCTCVNSQSCQMPALKSIVTKVGENCTESSQCNMQQSHCNEEVNKCKCNVNTVSSEDKRRCLNVSYSIGSPCEEDVQCNILNGVCKKQKCRCPDNLHNDKGICFKSVALGLSCQKDEECSVTDFSSCIANKCACEKKYIQSTFSSKCLSKAQHLLSACSEDIQCTSLLGLGSKCFKGVCACTELYQYRTNIQKCVLDARLGETCGNHLDCHQPGRAESRLDCVIGVCKCKPDYYEDQGFCLVGSAKGLTSFNLRDILPYVISYIVFYLIV